MDAVGPTDFTLYIERVVEPYTGMPLLGVSGFAPTRDWKVQVWYDAELAIAVDAASGEGHAFSTQIPWEPAERIRVVACGVRDVVLFDGTASSIGDRAKPADTRGTGFLRRAIRSVTSGEVLSLSRWGARLGRFWGLSRTLRHKLRNRRLDAKAPPRPPHDAYVERTAIDAAVEEQLRSRAAALRYRPTISILMPVYNVAPIWFRQAVASVVGQLYENWELCIADDCSTKPELMAEFATLPDDPRIKFVKRERNGHICAATNSAADLATGEYVALLDHDDCLAPDALLEVVTALQSRPDADLIYTDEDKIDVAGHRYDPQLKPDWSPELLLSYNYVNHFTVLRRSLFESVGRFRIGYEGSQDHDLLLRTTERTDRILHVPRILYHWRAHPESTAGRATQKTIVHSSGRKAVQDALARRGIAASLGVPAFAERLGLPILELDGADDGPSVAVIIFGPDAAATARTVAERTDYRKATPYLVLDADPPAEALNRLAAARSEDLLLFLRAGTEPADPRWLSRLVANLAIPGVGAAGGLTRTADGTVASAGTVLGLHDGTAPDHAGRGTPADGVSYYFYAETTRNVAAVGAGCLLTQRATFDELGGFDCDRFGRTLFDIEYCTRLRLRGRRCVHVGGAALQVALDEARVDDPLELRSFRAAYGRCADPYSNPQFDEARAFRPSGDVAVALPPGDRPPIQLAVAAHNLNNPEGAPRYLSEIVLGLRERGAVTPQVWSPLGGAGERVYSRAGIPVAIANEPWSRRFVDGRWTRREYDSARHALRRWLAERRPDAVLANTLLTFPMVEAAAGLGIPSIWIIHESYAPDVLDRLFPAFIRGRIEAAFRLASRVVPASHDTARIFERLDVRGNVRVIHNGIPDERPLRQPVGDRRKRILSIGTVCERKGQHTLVEAAAILARTRRDFLVEIVGLRDVVPYSGYVRQLVERRGLKGFVDLVSETDDAARYYKSADIFACTSHMETFSRSVLEAEMHRLPIVSTPCQGIGEQVNWNWNAVRFEPGDSAGLARQLDRLLTDDRLRTDMGRRSRAMFENNLDVMEMLDRYELVIRSAIGRASWETGPATVRVRRAA
ncbi:MAG: glycosyltransferase [Gemmataceae bacterium]|nr:glycosyltransferase [Gemmataceae bacterium]